MSAVEYREWIVRLALEAFDAAYDCSQLSRRERFAELMKERASQAAAVFGLEVELAREGSS